MKKNTLEVYRLLLFFILVFLTNNTIHAQCSSNGNDTSYEHITRVNLNTINNSSSDGTTSTGYSDFTNISTSLTTGSNYTINVSQNSSYNEYYYAWIDYNQNNDFTDPGEQVLIQTTTGVASNTFTVPSGATAGATMFIV